MISGSMLQKKILKNAVLQILLKPEKGDAATILEYLPEDFKVDFAFIDAKQSPIYKIFPSY